MQSQPAGSITVEAASDDLCHVSRSFNENVHFAARAGLKRIPSATFQRRPARLIK